jgi:hypothetical protein
MDNLEELLLPPTDAAAYMQNLVFTYGEEVHTEEDSAWGLLDTMFSVVPDKLAGVQRGFIRTATGIEMSALDVDIQDIDELSPYEGHARLTIRW